MSHENSIQTNINQFAIIGELYDSKESVQTLTDLFTLSLLDFDVEASRKLPEDTEQPLTNDQILKLTSQFPDPEALIRKLIHKDTCIVDFACGTGLVLEKIAPYIPQGKFIGVDISEAMLSKFNGRGEKLKSTYPDLTIQSVCGDIMDRLFDASKLEKSADVLLCSLAFHHLHEYKQVAQKLKTLVKPGGWIFIYDFYNEDNELPVSAALAARGVSRHGLSIDEMNDCFKDGCRNVSSAREFKVKLWQEEEFVLSHCCLAITDHLEQYEKKGDLYCVECSVILGVAQVV